jgi:DNA polymerase-3 subunit alpha
MGKKDKEKMAKEKEKFVKGAKEIHGIEKEKAEEVFAIMEKFAEYGFNRSHSAAYSVVAYQTAYLKANYPAEYMAAVLTHNMSNIDKISFFMEECKKMNVDVLGPDVNESNTYFDVNKEGKIRFGLGAIKGTGDAAVECIITEREENGAYDSIFDFSKRVNLRAVNKKTFEAHAYAGAFDSFPNIHRAQYFHSESDNSNLIEKAIRFGNNYKAEQETSQVSLFGGGSSVEIPLPKIPPCEPWNDIEKLKYEKEVVGFYISGHPLDQYKLELDNFCTASTDRIYDFKGREVAVAGIVSKTAVRQTKTGKTFCLFSIEDFNGSLDMALFGEDYLKLAHYIRIGEFLYIKGKVQQRYNSVDQWELKPVNIQLLADVRSKLCKDIHINVDLSFLNYDTLARMEDLFESYNGSCNVRFFLSERNENINVEMFCRRFKVEPNNELIAELNKLNGIKFKFTA